MARTSDPIIAAYPVPGMPYALLLTKSRVQLHEFDGRDARAAYTLLGDRRVEQVGVESRGRKIRAITTEPSGARALVDLWIR